MRILFYSPDSASLFLEGKIQTVGGAEVRMFQFARYLANKHIVKVLFHTNEANNGCKERVRFASVDFYLSAKLSKVKRLCDRFIYGVKGLNHIDYNRYLQFKELISFKPEIVCLFGITNLNLKTAELCQDLNFKTVLFIASDEEITFEQGEIETKYSKKSIKLVNNLIHKTNLCFVQNSYQLGLMSNIHSKKAILINSPILLNANNSSRAGKFALWVGKDVFYKQPLIFIEIARTMPSIEFVMICNRVNNEPYTFEQSSLPNNLVLIEHVPYEKIDKYFMDCFCFVNTSLYEGFPNTFLNALKFGKPVFSLNINPDEFITKEQCGFFSNGDVYGLANEISGVFNDNKKYLKLVSNAYNYIKKHDIKYVGKIVEEFMFEVL